MALYYTKWPPISIIKCPQIFSKMCLKKVSLHKAYSMCTILFTVTKEIGLIQKYGPRNTICASWVYDFPKKTFFEVKNSTFSFKRNKNCNIELLPIWVEMIVVCCFILRAAHSFTSKANILPSSLFHSVLRNLGVCLRF